MKVTTIIVSFAAIWASSWAVFISADYIYDRYVVQPSRYHWTDTFRENFIYSCSTAPGAVNVPKAYCACIADTLQLRGVLRTERNVVNESQEEFERAVHTDVHAFLLSDEGQQISFSCLSAGL